MRVARQWKVSSLLTSVLRSTSAGTTLGSDMSDYNYIYGGEVVEKDFVDAMNMLGELLEVLF